MAAASILVIDDDPDIQEILGDRLAALGHRVISATTGLEGLNLFDKVNPQLVLLDVAIPDLNGFDILRQMRSRQIEVPVVMITAYASIESAIEAIKEGASDFIPKPFDADHVAVVVAKALEQERLKREITLLNDEARARSQLIIGKSALMNQALETAKKAAASKSTVLLLGESGTGKEMLARAIHDWSDRKERPFVAINCVGLAKELLESELFGHEKGAFTGAHQLKKGKIELAHGGTVLLDEIGDISLEIQAKLLRFLQEREFERVGGTQAINVDIRVVAATSRNIDRAVAEGLFRDDLYYRLQVVPIALPPLRERKEDIAALARYFIVQFALETKKRFTGISDDAMEILEAYRWPGNVRELANVIERAVVLGSGPLVQISDLPPRLKGSSGVPGEHGRTYRQAVNDLRRDLITRALSQNSGNQAAAARTLGLHRKYLHRLIKALHIQQ